MHLRLCFLASALAIVLVILGGLGCASLSPAPFTALASSMQQLRDGTDASLSVVYERTRDRYIAEAAAGDGARVIALLLIQPPGNLFGWSSSSPGTDLPLFLRVAQFREGVNRFNSVLVSYAGLLGQLVSPDLLSSDKFDQLAKDLNSNFKNAVQTFSIQTPPNKEIAIFSTIATTAFRVYLQNKQQSSLLEALNSNQSVIQDAAELGASAVRITALALRNEYDNSSKNLAVRSASSTLSNAEKEAILRQLVELNDKFIKEMSVLQTLNHSYTVLPVAHRELAKGLIDPKRGLPMVYEILENGRQLNRLYGELRN
jgi:hypothetical protein